MEEKKLQTGCKQGNSGVIKEKKSKQGLLELQIGNLDDTDDTDDIDRQIQTISHSAQFFWCLLKRTDSLVKNDSKGTQNCRVHMFIDIPFVESITADKTMR